ncbi:MAG TPA: hypothetical protein VH414_03985 [Lichenihabitans sp.]|jgi:hypothetical protein|nr:hypothetical protein [Lichenihabitans sp.]
MEPSIEERVSSLEAKIDRVEAILVRLEPKITEVLLTGAKALDLAEIKGRLSMLPTWWMLMVTVLSTWMVGAGIVFTLVKATHQ